jgi:hypothetical protein
VDFVGNNTPEEKEDFLSPEFIMKIINQSDGKPLNFEQIRDLFPTRTERRFWVLKRTVKPNRVFIHLQIKNYIEKGILKEVGEDKYLPIDKEEYYKSALGGLLENEGYRVLDEDKHQQK